MLDERIPRMERFINTTVEEFTGILNYSESPGPGAGRILCKPWRLARRYRWFGRYGSGKRHAAAAPRSSPAPEPLLQFDL